MPRTPEPYKPSSARASCFRCCTALKSLKKTSAAEDFRAKGSDLGFGVLYYYYLFSLFCFFPFLFFFWGGGCFLGLVAVDTVCLQGAVWLHRVCQGLVWVFGQNLNPTPPPLPPRLKEPKPSTLDPNKPKQKTKGVLLRLPPVNLSNPMNPLNPVNPI